MEQELALTARLWLALTLPFRVLFDAALAGRIARLDRDAPASLPEPEPAPRKEVKAEPVVEPEPDLTPALQLLAILQREGRFVDFLQEDVSGFSDADIGAAARVVHEGCARGLKDTLQLAAIRTESEGDRVELPAGYDAKAIRVTGNVTGEPPFSGTLAHHGWRVETIRLPELSEGHDPMIIAPAEVEL